MMSAECPRCNNKVFQPEEANVNGTLWHLQCLKCSICKRRLNIGTLSSHRGQIFCRRCYDSLNLGSCGKNMYCAGHFHIDYVTNGNNSPRDELSPRKNAVSKDSPNMELAEAFRNGVQSDTTSNSPRTGLYSKMNQYMSLDPKGRHSKAQSQGKKTAASTDSLSDLRGLDS